MGGNKKAGKAQFSAIDQIFNQELVQKETTLANAGVSEEARIALLQLVGILPHILILSCLKSRAWKEFGANGAC